MAVEASRSNGGSNGGACSGAADSYLGSLISLTSKSEIRYEGVLFNVNTEEASIGLRNVRSFGTEGRRKDGQQVPAIDKVYEYIVFRGSDIKDLQVKSSPPVQSALSVHNDPAIIQSQYTGPTAPSSLPTAAIAPAPSPAGSLSDFGSQIPQSGIPRTTYQSSAPLYQPVGNLAWNPSVPPTAYSSGPSVPMYLPGHYGASASVQTQPQQLLRPNQGLPMHPSLQPPLAQQSAQYPAMNSSVLSGPSNFPASQSMEFPPPLLQPILSSNVSMSSSTVLPVQSFPVPVQAVSLGNSSMVSSTLSNMLDKNTVLPAQSFPAPVHAVSLGNSSVVSSTLSNVLDKNTVPSLIPNQPKAISGSSMPEHHSSVGGVSGSPALVTPGQFLHPGSTISQTSQMAQKDVEVVHSSLSSPPQPPVTVTAGAARVPVSTDTHAPLLPLPTPSNLKMNGVPCHSRQVNHRVGRGRGRGRGNEFSRPLTNFAEEFDFEAMNEQFKKDEVWDDLGKSKVTADDGLGLQDEDGIGVPVDKKPVYNKDDFFDTLSCNALNRESRNGRPRFSEQMKLDTQTFGDFSRNRGFRGRGPGRGGRGRGGYSGRGYGYGYGYGYGGRGRGHNVYRAI